MMKIQSRFSISLVFLFLLLLSSQIASAQLGNGLCESNTSIKQIAQFGEGQANRIEVSPNGKTLAIANSDGVWLYDANILKPLQVIQNESPEQALDVEWSPDGSKLAVLSAMNSIQIWKINDHSIEITIPVSGRKVVWSPDGSTLAGIDFSGSVSLWNAETGQLLNTYSSQVTGIAWSPDSRYLAIGNAPEQASGMDVYLWDVHSTEQPHLLGTSEANAQEESYLAWSPDGSQLVIGGKASDAIEMWDVGQSKVVMSFPHNTLVPAEIHWSPDGNKVAIGGIGNDYNLFFWDITHKTVQPVEASKNPITHFTWSPDGTQVFFTSTDGTLNAWEVVEKRLKQTVKVYRGRAGSPTWSPDGIKIAVAYAQDNNEGSVVIWDVTSQEAAWEINISSAIYSLAWSPDGKRLALAIPGNIQIWSIDNKNAPQLTWGGDGLTGLFWSPDEKQIASVSSEGNLIQIWDAATGKKGATFKPNAMLHGGQILWTIEGLRWMVITNSSQLQVWDANAKDPLLTLDNISPNSSSFFLPSATKFVANQQIWDIPKRGIIAPFSSVSSGGKGSPHEDCIASIQYGSTPSGMTDSVLVGLWNVGQSKQVTTLPVGYGVSEVTGLAWSPDGTKLASTAADGVVRIWGSQ
jgi:WD40 repeat protein